MVELHPEVGHIEDRETLCEAFFCFLCLVQCLHQLSSGEQVPHGHDGGVGLCVGVYVGASPIIAGSVQVHTGVVDGLCAAPTYCLIDGNAQQEPFGERLQALDVGRPCLVVREPPARSAERFLHDVAELLDHPFCHRDDVLRGQLPFHRLDQVHQEPPVVFLELGQRRRLGKVHDQQVTERVESPLNVAA